MDLRVGLILLCVFTSGWSCNARQLFASDISVLKMNLQEREMDLQALEIVGEKEDVCALCVQFASKVLDYLNDNNTQIELIDTFHTSCSQLRSFKQECDTMVDYYVPLLFLEISSLHPRYFCKRVNLCGQAKDSCNVCHQTVAEILLKLQDPDTQLEILEILLKVCNGADKNAKKCKKLVLAYGPLILTNAEKFIEKTDICLALHACSKKQDSPLLVLSDS